MFKLPISAYRCFQKVLIPSTPALHQWTTIRDYGEQKKTGSTTPDERDPESRESNAAGKKNADPVVLINELIETNSDVAEFGERSILRTYNILSNTGFYPSECIHMINVYPKLLRFQSKDLEKRLELWRVCQFSKTQYFNLFIEQPVLLECDDEEYLSKRFCQLQQFSWTSKNIWRLFILSPNVLFDPIKSVNQKVDYILDTMQADMTDLVKSGSLAQPLNTIKSRHALLIRLGLYKKRNMKASELSQNKNPRLTRIMDTSDKEFARKVCGITIGELEVFYELHKRELKEIEKDEQDYLEDSDEEIESEESDEEFNFDARESADYYDDRHKRSYNKRPRNKKE